jgi:hypothetical protein
MSPLTPYKTGCKPCVYRRSDTLAPLNKKISLYKNVDFSEIMTIFVGKLQQDLKPET